MKLKWRQELRLLYVLTKREYKTRYLGSWLGSYWNFLHPLIMILIYTLVFSSVMKARLGEDKGPFAYSLYLCIGLLPWHFFCEIVNKGATTLVDNADFIKKLAFQPRTLFKASVVSSAINFIISFSLFLIFFFFIKPVDLGLFFTFWVVLSLMAYFASQIGVAFGCLNVFARDVQQLTNIVFQLWFWSTPIVYQSEHLPVWARQILLFNPAYAFIEPMHNLLFDGRYPESFFWFLMLAWVGVSVVISRFIYQRTISLVRDNL